MLAGVGNRSRKAKNQSLPAVAREAVDLGEIERQVMRQDPMLDLGLRLGDRLMGLRQFLHVVDAGASGSR